MRTLIVYSSMCHGNTEKIAKAIAEVLEADLRNPDQVPSKNLFSYDLIGLGSGIYFWKHHQSLFDLLGRLAELKKKVFVFSTRGMGPAVLYHKALKKKLKSMGCSVVGEFSCKGFDDYAVLKLIGGINKGKPNEKDIENAKRFARSLIK